MRITKHIDEVLKEYLELRKQYEILSDEAFDLCEAQYEKRETAYNFAEWADEYNRLSNIRDYYDMIIKEINQAIHLLKILQKTKNHIEIYKTRVDNLNKV